MTLHRSRRNLEAHERLDEVEYNAKNGGDCAFLHDTWLKMEENAVEEVDARLQEGGRPMLPPQVWSHATVAPWVRAVADSWSSIDIVLQSLLVKLAARFDAPATGLIRDEDACVSHDGNNDDDDDVESDDIFEERIM